MKKRINFTGRRSLPAENVRVRIRSPQSSGEAPSFSAELTLPEQWHLDPRAKVYVEPYVKSSSMRFEFGTVGQLTPPTDTRLLELDHSDNVLFRVRVVDESEEIGKILASANRIQPSDEQGAKSLLPLKLTDLGEGVWNLVLSGGAPSLELNNNIPGIRDRLMQDPLLQGAILPEALRQILNDILTNDEYDDEMGWVQDWKNFAGRLLGHELPENLADEDQETERSRMIEEVIARFCQLHRFASSARKLEERNING